MNNTKLKFKNINLSSKNIKEKVDIGKCIKIVNSKKNYQVIGINPKKDLCWVREWPLNFSSYKTFALSLENITISTLCDIENNK